MKTRALALALALLHGAPMGAVAAEAPDGEWAIVASPNSGDARTHNFLTAAACPAANDCWAVGYYNNTVSSFQPLVQRWDGSAWSAVPAPGTGVTNNDVLRAVTCVSATDCWAVGSTGEPGSPQRTLVLHWDGAAWATVPSPNSGPGDYNYLLGVACTGASDCWAVGYRNANGGFQTLALRWDGTAWGLAASPNAGGTQSFLQSVHCVAAADCWAVGWSVNPATGFNQTLIERWNGAAWTVVASPNALLSTHNDLHGVTCVSANDCWAVGSWNNGSVRQPLAQRWNGSSWAVVAAPGAVLTQDHLLRSVSCASGTECWAVGAYADGGTRTLVLRWDGGQWTPAASPNAGAGEDNTLFAVACRPGTAGCWAAGYHLDAGINDALLLRGSGGTWTIAAADNRRAPQHNTLLGVACGTPDECWAVASYFAGGVQQTLIQRWDGSAWAIEPSPNTDVSQSNILYDVSCAAPADCWAVGYFLGEPGFQTLTLHWDGVRWEIVASPSVAGGNNFLTDVTCLSAGDCWAVGFHDTGVYQTLVLHWDSSAWHIVESPNTDAGSENRLAGISCVSASDCWAVGFHKVGGILQRTLIQQWDGSAWRIIASPNTDPAQNNTLEDVACASPTVCWAVGAYSPGAPGTGQPLIQRWDGSAWTLAAAPQPSANANNYLRSVTCPAAAECWAVGDFFAGGHARSFIARWNGAAWAVVVAPNTSPTQGNRLVGVTCPSADECWSVGYFTDDAGIFHTLTERYQAPRPQAPEAFAFVTRLGVATGVVVTSEGKTVTGFTGTLPVSIYGGGQYRIDDGAWTGTPGLIAPGSRLAVRHVSASTASTATTSTVSTGEFSTEFRSVTAALDQTPDAFGFATQTGVAPGAIVDSNAITLTGYNTGIALQPGPGLSYRIDGGAWTTGSGTLQPGQTLQVRHTASATPGGYAKTYVKVGGVTGYFTTRTQ